MIFSQISISILAGAPGLEPGPSVLETDMLAIDTMPLYLLVKRQRCTKKNLFDFRQLLAPCLFHFFVGDMLSAKSTIFFHLKTIRIILLVFHCRIVPSLTLTTS